MDKYMRIQFGNGDIFEIEADLVARDRARYYTDRAYEQDKNADLNKLSAEEQRYAMRNPDELIDWLQNNMDWDEIKHVARLVSSETYDHSKMFGQANVSVIEQ